MQCQQRAALRPQRGKAVRPVALQVQLAMFLTCLQIAESINGPALASETMKPFSSQSHLSS